MSALRENIGPFTVVREIGRGGMGVVYLARDERLDREVAIKCLPDELANDPVRLERFEREAKTLAQLNHTNVAAIYGVEEQDGQKYLILEYVEGETLGDRLDSGALPIDEALEIAVEMAKGVEAAHEAGVIHRDLKPDNIKITPDGKVKVLDFGLARTEEGVSSSITEDPTRTTPRSPTMPGAILGTAPYMSPEQARGRKVDKRTDIWSFGVILYEMLTGANPFVGESANDSIGAVLHKEIDPSRLPAATPFGARHIIERCLQRSRDDRYRDIGDVRIELQRAGAGEASPWLPAGGTTGRSAWRTLGLISASGAATALISAFFFWGFRPSPAPPEAPVPVHLTVESSTGSATIHDPDISNDGRRILMYEEGGELRGWTLVVRDLDTLGVRTLVDSAPSAWKALSPDGEWLAFIEDGKLKKTPIDGGASITICDVPQNGRIVTPLWTEDGALIVSVGASGLHRVSADPGGTLTPMYEKDDDTTIDVASEQLPGRKGVLFTRVGTDRQFSWEDASLMVLAKDGDEPRELVRSAGHGRYLSTGHLVYQRDTTLMAVGFDLERLAVTTPERPVLRGVNAGGHFYGQGIKNFDISRDGTLAYVVERPESSWIRSTTVGLLDLEGAFTPLLTKAGYVSACVPSSDDRQVAMTISNEDPDGGFSTRMHILERARDLLSEIAPNDEKWHTHPVWEPGGRRIVFARHDSPSFGGSWRAGSGGEICRHRVGSQTEPEVLAAFETSVAPSDFSSDGRLLLSWANGEAGTFLGLLRFDEQGQLLSPEPEPLIDWPRLGSRFDATFSPDDRWVLFSFLVTSGHESEVFVVSVDDPSRSVQISVGGGAAAAWAPDVDRVYYTGPEIVDEERRTVFYAVDFVVNEEGDFIPSAPSRLFDTDGISRPSIPMTADGKSFYVTRRAEPGPDEPADDVKPEPLQVITNWPESIKDLLPRTNKRE